MTATRRNWNAYELNHLMKHGFKQSQLDPFDPRPVEYITGMAQFLDREFVVTGDTLIPRIETEELVNLVTLDAKHFSRILNRPLTILDVGTGSGCIGLSLLMNLEMLQPKLYLLDISPAALEVAKTNLKRLITKSNQPLVKLIESDLITRLADSVTPDIVVANLPYLSSDSMDNLDESVSKCEPHQALSGGGTKGLGLVHQLLEQLSLMPQPPLSIWLEIDEFVTHDDLHTPSIYHSRLLIDSFGKIRFAHLTKQG